MSELWIYFGSLPHDSLVFAKSMSARQKLDIATTPSPLTRLFLAHECSIGVRPMLLSRSARSSNIWSSTAFEPTTRTSFLPAQNERAIPSLRLYLIVFGALGSTTCSSLLKDTLHAEIPRLH